MAALHRWCVAAALFLVAAGAAEAAGPTGKAKAAVVEDFLGEEVIKAFALKHKDEITVAAQDIAKKGVEAVFAKLRSLIPEDDSPLPPLEDLQKPDARILGPDGVESIIKTALEGIDPLVLSDDPVNIKYALYDDSASIDLTAQHIEASEFSSLAPKIDHTIIGSPVTGNHAFNIDINLKSIKVNLQHDELVTFLFLKRNGKGDISLNLHNIHVSGRVVVWLNAPVEECQLVLDASKIAVEFDISGLLGSDSLSSTVSKVLTDLINDDLMESIISVVKPIVDEQACDIVKQLPQAIWLTLILGVTSIDLP